MRLLSWSVILAIAPWSSASAGLVQVTPSPPAVTPTATAAPSELAAFILASYTKHEHEIAMRDGVRLHTAVYVPKDESRRYAILLQRTPYSTSPYGADNYRQTLGPSERFARDGFIFVYQDVRGRNLSEGEFIETTPHRP
ncbi:MAG TPA: CocE/NonD family hydrolase, partial [Thermoanaerobaculia bacterium]|nr:CocE/NonD family hydrolase [Thermoanaerobaculia bacterium]